MEHDEGSELARILEGVTIRPTVEPVITDEQLLSALNDLRHFEKLAPLETLPTPLATLTQIRKRKWLTRFLAETNLHKQSPQAEPSIFVNRTELHLISLNRFILNDTDTVPITSFPYQQIDSNDLSFYYPAESDKTQQVFITDSDTRLIGTPTYVQSGKYIAPHQLHLTGTPNITPVPFLLPILARCSTPLNQSESDKSDTNSTTSTDSSQRLQNNKMADDKIQEALAREQQAKAKIIELEDELTALTSKINNMKVQPTEKPKAKSEREEISELKKFINLMIKNVETSTGIELNATVEERQLIDNLKESAEDDYPKLVYKLQFPDNIIDPDTKREPPILQILKPSVIANTIGTFDPDINPSIDFKGIWERIVDHTKQFTLFEHEYITILRMVMKGTAASSLDKITKECQGNLTDTLEAIQDLYIPQLTVFDEFDELNHFTRRKGEHIRTAMRRASMAVFPIRDTVTKAAWPDRRYHLLRNMLNQMLDRKTLRHLQMKEKNAPNKAYNCQLMP